MFFEIGANYLWILLPFSGIFLFVKVDVQIVKIPKVWSLKILYCNFTFTPFEHFVVFLCFKISTIFCYCTMYMYMCKFGQVIIKCFSMFNFIISFQGFWKHWRTLAVLEKKVSYNYNKMDIVIFPRIVLAVL